MILNYIFSVFSILVFLNIFSLPDGSLDRSFGNNGLVTTNFSSIGNNQAYAIAIQGDGKIIAAGLVNNTNTSNKNNFGLARYRIDGSLDKSFGNNGLVTTDFLGDDNEAHALVIQPDGKIIAGGFLNNGSNLNFALARYNIDGSLDKNFGNNGLVITDFLSGFSSASYSLSIQPDGKVVATGFVDQSGGKSVFALSRYDLNGSLDKSFGDNGLVITPFLLNNDYNISFASAIQANGKIIAAGFISDSSTYSHNDFGLIRYNIDGSIDKSFGNNGVVTTDFFNDDDKIFDIAIQADGKILAAGFVRKLHTDLINNIGITRYNVNGSLDNSFGMSGKVVADFSSGEDNELSYVGLGIQSDGKILVTGVVNDTITGNNNNFGIARYNINGSKDLTFGTNGLTVTQFVSPNINDISNKLAIQKDGKIVLVGLVNDDPANSNYLFGLTRYNVNNTPLHDTAIENVKIGKNLEISGTAQNLSNVTVYVTPLSGPNIGKRTLICGTTTGVGPTLVSPDINNTLGQWKCSSNVDLKSCNLAIEVIAWYPAGKVIIGSNNIVNGIQKKYC